jgi:hypothetical protein
VLPLRRAGGYYSRSADPAARPRFRQTVAQLLREPDQWRLAIGRGPYVAPYVWSWRLALTSTKSKTATSALGREGAGLYLCQGGTIAIFRRRRMMQSTALVNPGRRASRRKADIFNYNNKL